MALGAGDIYTESAKRSFVQSLMNVLVAGGNISLAEIDGKTKIQINNAIVDYLKSVRASFTPTGDSFAISFTAVAEGSEQVIDIQLDSATESETGLMNKSQVAAIKALQQSVNSLQGGINLLNATDFGRLLDLTVPSDIQTLTDYAHSQGVNPIVTGTCVRNSFDGNTYLWQSGTEPDGRWTLQGTKFFGDVQIGENDGSNGIVHGRAANGYIYIEADGLMSLWGYDELVEKQNRAQAQIKDLEDAIKNIKPSKIVKMDKSNTDYELTGDSLIMLVEPIANPFKVVTNGYKFCLVNLADFYGTLYVDGIANMVYKNTLSFYVNGTIMSKSGMLPYKQSQINLEAFNTSKDTVEIDRADTAFFSFLLIGDKPSINFKTGIVINVGFGILLISNLRTVNVEVRAHNSKILDMAPDTIAIVVYRHPQFGIQSSKLFYSGDVDAKINEKMANKLEYKCIDDYNSERGIYPIGFIFYDVVNVPFNWILELKNLNPSLMTQEKVTLFVKNSVGIPNTVFEIIFNDNTIAELKRGEIAIITIYGDSGYYSSSIIPSTILSKKEPDVIIQEISTSPYIVDTDCIIDGNYFVLLLINGLNEYDFEVFSRNTHSPLDEPFVFEVVNLNDTKVLVKIGGSFDTIIDAKQRVKFNYSPEKGFFKSTPQLAGTVLGANPKEVKNLAGAWFDKNSAMNELQNSSRTITGTNYGFTNADIGKVYTFRFVKDPNSSSMNILTYMEKDFSPNGYQRTLTMFKCIAFVTLQFCGLNSSGQPLFDLIGFQNP